MKFRAFLAEGQKDFELTKLEDADEDVLKNMVDEQGLKLRFYGKTLRQVLTKHLSLKVYRLLLLYQPVEKRLYFVWREYQRTGSEKRYITPTRYKRVATHKAFYHSIYFDESGESTYRGYSDDLEKLINDYKAGKFIDLSQVERWLRCAKDGLQVLITGLKEEGWLKESISAVKNNVVITTQHDPAASTGDTISTYFKRQPYHTALQHNEIYSILNYVSTPETMKLLTSLKGRGPYEVSGQQLERFLDQVTHAASGLLHRLKPEVIIYPASTSDLVSGFVTHLVKAYPHIEATDEAFVKKSLKGADVKAVLNMEHPEWEKFAAENPKAVEQLKQSLKHHLEAGELELKKLYKPYLKFIKNFIQLKDVSETIDVVNGKRVLIVDDVLSTGTTIREMIRQIQELEPASVHTLTIFKRTNLISVSKMIPVEA